MVTCFKQLCRSDQCVVADSCGLPRPGVFCQASASNIHLWVMSTAAHYRQLSVDVEGESERVNTKSHGYHMTWDSCLCSSNAQLKA